MGLSVTRGREILQRIPLCVDSSVGEQTHTKESAKTADAIFHVSLWTIPSSQEGEGENERWRKCEKMVLKTCQESKAIKKVSCLPPHWIFLDQILDWNIHLSICFIPPLLVWVLESSPAVLGQICFHSLDNSPVYHMFNTKGQTTIQTFTQGQFRVASSHCVHVFGQWEDQEVVGENPGRHRKNVQTKLRKSDWTARPFHCCVSRPTWTYPKNLPWMTKTCSPSSLRTKVIFLLAAL